MRLSDLGYEAMDRDENSVGYSGVLHEGKGEDGYEDMCRYYILYIPYDGGSYDIKISYIERTHRKFFRGRTKGYTKGSKPMAHGITPKTVEALTNEIEIIRKELEQYETKTI